MLQLSTTQKQTSKSIIGIFETSRLPSKEAYSQVTLLKGDSGGLTYGMHQVTLNSGNLYMLILTYVSRNGAYSNSFKEYLELLKHKSYKLASNTTFKELLKKAGSDPVMQATQEEYFDKIFWQPALEQGQLYGFELPLSYAVIYDSFIHGSWKLIKDRTLTVARTSEETKWITAYVNTRKNWLSTHSNKLLHKTVYRMDTFLSLIKANNWRLDLPLDIRGVKITAEKLALLEPPVEDKPPKPVIVQADENRLLRVTKPYMRGDDVSEVQYALSQKGFYKHKVDGVYGPLSAEAVKKFQQSVGIESDGLVGNITRGKLGLL